MCQTKKQNKNRGLASHNLVVWRFRILERFFSRANWHFKMSIDKFCLRWTLEFWAFLWSIYKHPNVFPNCLLFQRCSHLLLQHSLEMCFGKVRDIGKMSPAFNCCIFACKRHLQESPVWRGYSYLLVITNDFRYAFQLLFKKILLPLNWKTCLIFFYWINRWKIDYKYPQTQIDVVFENADGKKRWGIPSLHEYMPQFQ